MHPYTHQAMSRRSLLVRAGAGAAGVGCGLLLAACGQAATVTTQVSASAPVAATSSTTASAASAGSVTATSSGAVTSAATASPSTVASAASTATAAPTTASSTAAASVTAASTAASAGNKAAVTLQYYTSLNQRQQKLFAPMVVQPFTQAHPGIAIEVVESQGSFYAKLTTMVAAGTPPDVVWEAYPEAYLGKLITDVTSYVNRDKLDISVYPQYAMDYDGLWQGKVLGLPNQTGGNWPVMPFNHDLFAAVGLPDPPDHWGEASWSYSAFVDACQKLTKTGPDGTPQSFAINDFGLGTVMLWWGLRYGGQWLSDDFTTVTCDSPQMIQGLQQLFDLPLKYKVMPKPGQLKTVFGDSNVMNLLKAGKLAMAIDSGGDMYNVATNDQAGADLSFGAQPTFPASTGDDQDVDPNGLAVGTRHPEEGWTFIRYQAETPGWAISRGNLPARKDLMPAWEQALWGGGIGTKARVAVYEDSINHTAKKDPIGHLSNWRDLYTNLIAPEFNKVWAGQAAVSDVLHALRPQLQSQVAKGMPA